MRLGPRRLLLVLHVISSVGWLGAAATYAVLAGYLMTHSEPSNVRAIIPLLSWAIKFAIVPLAVVSFLTGVIQGLCTTWGLFRHYWVMYKFLMSCFALFALYDYSSYILQISGESAHADVSQLHSMTDPSHLVHSVGGLAFLVTTTVLAVSKPRGLTPRGWRKQHQARQESEHAALV